MRGIGSGVSRRVCGLTHGPRPSASSNAFGIMGGYFVCQLKQNRPMRVSPSARIRQHPYGHAVGTLSGGLKGGVVKDRRKDDATTG